MGISIVPTPSASSKTLYMQTLTSGSTWTVPTGVNYVNVTLFGGGGGGAGYNSSPAFMPSRGTGGSIRTSIVNTTPGASISYSIGAGGAGSTTNNNNGQDGGTTTFTGATSAPGGFGSKTANNGGAAGSSGRGSNNGGGGMGQTSGSPVGGAGGAGKIDIQYWQ